MLASNFIPIKKIEEIQVGMTANTTRTFLSEDIELFSNIASDHAPVHKNKEFSIGLGYEDVLVFGWLATSPFSGLLGNRLPGPYSVLHSFKLGMSSPVYLNQEILYTVEVTNISFATKAVMLNLTANRQSDGAVLIRGQAQCGFRA